MITGLKARLDYGDYCAIPPDGKRYELLDGEVHVTPAPTPSHQRVVLRLARILEDYFGERAEVFVAPVDVILTPHDVVQPDLVVVFNPAQVSERGIEGIPLLVVEVLSPATTAYDRSTKAVRYATLGVPHYWIADSSARRLEPYRREGSAYRPLPSAGPDETFLHPDFPILQIPLSLLYR
jgi:Uma2 family endonuclease